MHITQPAQLPNSNNGSGVRFVGALMRMAHKLGGGIVCQCERKAEDRDLHASRVNLEIRSHSFRYVRR